MSSSKPSQFDLAAGLNVSQPMVSKLKKRGMPTHSVAAAVAWRAENLNVAHHREKKSAGPRPSDDVDVNAESFNEARRRREVAEANTAEMKYGELQKVLVRRERVEAIWRSKYATSREALLQIPVRLAAVVAAEASETACHALIDAEIRAALEHLAGADS